MNAYIYFALFQLRPELQVLVPVPSFERPQRCSSLVRRVNVFQETYTEYQ